MANDTAVPIILFVDDNPHDAKLFSRLFTEGSFNGLVHWIDDSDIALSYLFSDADMPAVIILDLHMPKIDGVEILRRLKASLVTKDIPVIVLSSSKDKMTEVECLDLGAQDFFSKPTCLDECRKLIEHLKSTVFIGLGINVTQ